MEPSMTPESARMILNLRSDDATQLRMDELGCKANEGTLTEDERTEHGRYVEIENYLSLLHARARKYLAEQGFGE